MSVQRRHPGASGREGARVVGEQRVFLISDQGLTSEAVAAALTDFGYAVRSLTTPRRPESATELRRQLLDFEPGVVLFLHEVPDPVQVREMRRLMSRSAELVWVLLTTSPEGPVWGAGIDAGASAVLPMDSTVQELAAALSLAFRGAPVMRADDRERLHRAWTDRPPEEVAFWDRLERLTQREAEVSAPLARASA